MAETYFVNAIQETISNLPLILEYFLPGYCSIFLYKKLRSITTEKKETESIQIGSSIVISYFISFLLSVLSKLRILPNIANNELRCIVEILVGALGTICILRLLRSPWIRKKYSHINNTALSRTVLECCDLSRMPKVTIYSENTTSVYGRLVNYNDEERDEWLALDFYEVYERPHKLVDHWAYHEHYSRYIIPLQKVVCIEVHYNDDSSMSPKWYQSVREKEIVALKEQPIPRGVRKP